ncbi:MAG: carboxyl transferase domain-containing protein [Melioribacteraceae bacterium]|nr:carboxyl transferase domain-containing protein [Melioribacteraceae bacterium]
MIKQTIRRKNCRKWLRITGKNLQIHFIAAERGFVDDVIKPRETRAKLINSFQLLKTKVDSNPKKKHCNIPL